jgi:hypothetical protein
MAERSETTPEENYGTGWLQCIEYTGRGAKDPVGGSLPEGWEIRDLVLFAKVKRGKNIIDVLPNDLKQDDRIIKAIIDEEAVKELYEEDPRAILLAQASGRADLTRLEWYTKYGRDGLRNWATSALKKPAEAPFQIKD